MTIVDEPKTYERGGKHGWLSDLCRKALGNDPEADERLHRYSQEQRVAPNLTAGTGGEFAPPAWLTELYSGGNRTARPLADMVPWMPLPGGRVSINLPDIISGPSVDEHTPNSSTQSVDITTTSLQSPVATISGQMDVSQQLFDLTPGEFDTLMWRELEVAYNERLEYNIVNSNGTLGSLNGLAGAIPLLSASNVIDGSAITTIPAFSTALGKACANVATNRKVAPQIIILAGRRWFWYASTSDTANRPIAGSNGNVTPLEQQAVMAQSVAPVVGPILGLPVYMDGAVAGGTSADNAYAARPGDMLLMEGPQYVMATPEPLAGTLGVRLSLHRNVAFFPLRATNALGVVQNLPQPSGF